MTPKRQRASMVDALALSPSRRKIKSNSPVINASDMPPPSTTQQSSPILPKSRRSTIKAGRRYMIVTICDPKMSIFLECHHYWPMLAKRIHISDNHYRLRGKKIVFLNIFNWKKVIIIIFAAQHRTLHDVIVQFHCQSIARQYNRQMQLTQLELQHDEVVDDRQLSGSKWNICMCNNKKMFNLNWIHNIYLSANQSEFNYKL
jgi:hypothetical protein